MKQPRRITPDHHPATHRFHVRIHFTNPAPNTAHTYIVGSSDQVHHALNDLAIVRRLHPDADVLDVKDHAVYTEPDGWKILPEHKEPPPCASGTPDKPASR